jgi:hypothetical protein
MDFDFTSEKGYQKFIITIIGIMGTILVSVFGVSPDKSNAILSTATIFAPMLATGLYYIVNQVAAAGKAKSEIARITATADAIAKTGILPETKPASLDPGQPVKSETPTPPPPAPAVTPFNQQAFMDEVNKTVNARYLVVNPSTVFYNAEQVFRDWAFNNEQAVKDAKALLLHLADTAFKSIWGASYKDAWTYINDPLGRGCPTCPQESNRCTYPDLKYKSQQLGTGYYTIFDLFRGVFFAKVSPFSYMSISQYRSDDNIFSFL